uniref:Putative secretory protein n=1 Tax=Parasacculina yatsui TaxID=2836420 RepID=A0A386AVT2_9CRUS|nr:putative secretory protein [Parasacculina yatsui]
MMFYLALVATLLLAAHTNAEVKENSENGAQERLIALYSTFSVTTVSTTTSTVFHTCNTVPTSATACKRRRRRRSNRQQTPIAHDLTRHESVPELSSSVDSSRNKEFTSHKSGRFFTYWTTTSTTLTTTIFATNFSTTHSFTLLCTAPGQTIGPNC